MVYPEFYDKLVNETRELVLNQDFLIDKTDTIIELLYWELMRFFDFGIENKKIIFHFYKDKYSIEYENFYGVFGSILGKVGLLVYTYCQHKEKYFDAALLTAAHLSLNKGNDYGNGTPFDNIYSQGNLGLISRNVDKITRQKQLIINHVEQKVQDESVLQSMLDLFNYSVYAIMLVEGKWNTEENIQKFYEYLRENGLGYMVKRYQ